MKPILLLTDRWLHWLDVGYVFTSALFVTIMMVVTFADVAMRYLLHAPLSWAYDLVSNYLLLGSFFFSFSYALRRSEHVAIDVFTQRLPQALYHRLLAVGYLAVTLVFAAIGWLGLVETLDAYNNNEAMMGALVWPMWPARIIVPLGMVPLLLRTAHRTFSHSCAAGDKWFQDALGLVPAQEHIVE